MIPGGRSGVKAGEDCGIGRRARRRSPLSERRTRRCAPCSRPGSLRPRAAGARRKSREAPHLFAAARIGPAPAFCTIAASARPDEPAGAGNDAARPSQWPRSAISRTTSLCGRVRRAFRRASPRPQLRAGALSDQMLAAPLTVVGLGHEGTVKANKYRRFSASIPPRELVIREQKQWNSCPPWWAIRQYRIYFDNAHRTRLDRD